MRNYLECGRVNNTHGVKGALRAEHWCDDEDVFLSLEKVYIEKDGGYTEYKVASSAPHGSAILLTLEGVDSLDAAVPLKGRTLYCRREDVPLPEGSRFIADLIGLPVIHADTGETIGELSDVINRGASDIYVIKKSDGTEALVPAVPEFIVSVDDDAVRIRPIEGLL